MTTPETPDIYEIGSRAVGEELTELEAQNWGLGKEKKDIGSMIEQAESVGGSLGLDEEEQAQAMIRGANRVRGILNERVKGLKIK